MELNKINFLASQAALNKQVKKEDDPKAEDKKEAEVRDNKPADKQVAGEDILTFMAAKTVDVKVRAKKTADASESVEDRVASYMADFEAAYDEAAALGLSEDAILALFDKM